MPSEQKLNVFVSSTSEDLRNHRAVARLVILDMGWMPIMMEHFGALPGPTVAACREKLSQCNLMVLIVAFRCGWPPTIEEGGNGVDSITALELAYAREKNIPVLAMRANEDTWPVSQYDKNPAARDWIDNFRATLNLPAESFDFEREDNLPGFRTKLSKALITFKERRLTQGVSRSIDSDGLDFFGSARSGIAEGEIIPFIGPEVYGDGPLSPQWLARGLGAEACGDQSCLATVAEYQEQRR